MSWSVTVNDLSTVEELPPQIIDKIGWDNPKYKEDAQLAFFVAKSCELDSVTLSGGRTPSPYGGPDNVVITIIGFDGTSGIRARDFNMSVLDNIFTGPDNENSERSEIDVPLPGRHRQE